MQLKAIGKDRRSYVSLGNVLTILAMLGALAASYATLSADNARTTQRLDTLEKRNEETRKEIKEVAHEIKGDVKEVKQDVQLILRKLDSLEAVRRSERRNGER